MSKKRLIRDTRPLEQPQDSYPFGKNGIQDNVLGSFENEPGFEEMQAAAPYKIIGVIPTVKFTVLISANGVNSAIGYFDAENDIYIPLFNDAVKPYKLALDPSYYVIGESQTNVLGEVIIAFTDKQTFFKYFNCDNPDTDSLDDFRFFPLADFPDIDVTQDSGGALLPGAYYVAIKYSKLDGAETGWLALSPVTIINGTAGAVTDKSLAIKLTNCDTDFEFVIVSIIAKVNGVATTIELEPTAIPSNGEVQIVYTGANFSTNITLEEVLIDPASYDRVKALTQLNDALYIANLEREAEINMQKYATLIKLEWVSELHDLSPPSDDLITGRKKGFMHEEVYAIYIQYSKTKGGWTKAFAIPGINPYGTVMDDSLEAGDQDVIGKKYQIEDTIQTFSSITKTGLCGVWLNQNENYPDTEDFDATVIGGRNLRGQPVLHHRMPSIRWCKENLYPVETAYGKTKLDLLGIKASSIIIPPQYTEAINGYRLLYARRTIGNSLVIGQSVMMHGVRDGSYYTNDFISVDSDYMSTAGNWHSRRTGSGVQTYPILIDRDILRFHAFDMLFNKPAVSPSYISLQLKMRKNGINELIEDFSITPGSKNGPVVWLVDYTKGITPTAAVTTKRWRSVYDGQYVPSNIITGRWKNLQMEAIWGGKMRWDPVLETVDVPYNEYHGGNHSYQPVNEVASYETTYLTNLMALKTDLYLPHNAQPLVMAGQARGTVATTFFGGDIFLSDYCFHTYGWPDGLNRSYGERIGGLKVARRFICESVSNINARYEIPGNPYSKWYPKFPLVPHEATNYLTNFDRNIDPNQFGYSKDLNALNDLLSAAIFNPNIPSITIFPDRIHRGGKFQRQGKSKNWRTFLPLDYYETQKNMDEIVKLEGMDDRLLIHHRNALFLTQDKTKLESGLLSVTLGTADIFQFEPQEALSAKLGYAGTQHDLACVRTPAGYVFIDAKMGHVFIYKGGLKQMNIGLNNFFREFLRLKDTNVFTGNGFTIGFDPDYKRILLTCKNQSPLPGLSGTVYYTYEATVDFITGLNIGDIVYKDGRWQLFLGVNTTEYDCVAAIIPTLNNEEETIPEDTLVDTLIVTMSGTNVAEAYIVAGNIGNAFRLDPITLQLRLNNPVDFETLAIYTLTVRGYSSDGNTVDATVIINITNVIESNCVPVTIDGEVSFPNAVVGQPYEYIVNLLGSAPFIWDAIVPGGWMTVMLVGNQLIFSGTPQIGDVDEEVEISFVVTNCSFSGSASGGDTIIVMNQPQSANDVRLSTNSGVICAEPGVTVYWATGSFGPGIILYQDIALSIPYTGFNYVSRISTSIIYAIDPVSAAVGADTGLAC